MHIWYTLGAVLGLVAVLTAFWVPIPLLTKSQGESPMEGKVRWVRRGISKIEVAVQQGMTADPLPEGGPITFMGGSITSFMYFRPWQTIPKEGMLVKAQTHNRLYWLRGISLNWVSSWEEVESVAPGGKMVIREIEPSHVHACAPFGGGMEIF